MRSEINPKLPFLLSFNGIPPALFKGKNIYLTAVRRGAHVLIYQE